MGGRGSSSGKASSRVNDSVKKANQLYDYLSQSDRGARTGDVQVKEAKEYLPKLYKAFSDTTQEHDALLDNFFKISVEQRARYKQLSNARQELAHFILKLEDKVSRWDSYQEKDKFKEKRIKAGITDSVLNHV